MGHTLEQFAAECRQALKTEPGPEGRKKVCAIVESVLKDDAFIAKHVGDDVPDRKILYEDPDMRFCILAHVLPGRQAHTRTTMARVGPSTAKSTARPR